MRSPFKVGDVCIGQNFVRDIDRNGVECTIIGGLEPRNYLDFHSGETFLLYCHEVEWSDGLISSIQPKNLRRKQPPSDITQWAASKVKDLLKPINNEVTA
jgi:hypothetical protein